MKMRPVPAIPVPANGKTELKPGGYHLMLMGLKHDLKPGENVAVILKFERGAEVRVEAPVK
jgi:periplasmic copper chaperone A